MRFWRFQPIQIFLKFRVIYTKKKKKLKKFSLNVKKSALSRIVTNTLDIIFFNSASRSRMKFQIFDQSQPKKNLALTKPLGNILCSDGSGKIDMKLAPKTLEDSFGNHLAKKSSTNQTQKSRIHQKFSIRNLNNRQNFSVAKS